MHSTADSPKMENTLYEHTLYTTHAELYDIDERVFLAYRRAKLVIQTWNLSLDDIATCSQRFWDMQLDPILAVDMGCINIIACHINLFLGTLAAAVSRRPDLSPIIQSGLRAEYFGNFLLTEVDHGLDIVNLETTATKIADGFILHTPHKGAAKFIPPTTPISGFPKMAIVMARLIVDGEDRDVHPFLVSTSGEQHMCDGVTSTRLPPRSGTSPLDYAITSFNHVKLPPSAFLGTSMELPRHRRASMRAYLRRIDIGVMALPLESLTALKMGACIATDYSYRRHVQGRHPRKMPIISFRTQQLPVLYAVAAAHVLDAWKTVAVKQYMSLQSCPDVQSGFSVVFKATVSRIVIMNLRDAGERLGAQGTFGHNLLSQFEMDSRGIVIAEGDVLVLSIRLFSELLLGRYALPPLQDTDSLLARHSAAVFARCATLLGTFPEGHRDARFNDLVLPQSELALTVLGLAYAHAAARAAGVPQPLIDLFECQAMKFDLAWYAEHAGLGTMERLRKEDAAVHAALPHLRTYADQLGVRPWVSAPIITDDAWAQWIGKLHTHSSNGADMRAASAQSGIWTDEKICAGDGSESSRAVADRYQSRL